MAAPKFDPDAYLAAPVAFDPDAYLAAAPAKFASNEVPNDRMPLTPAPAAPSLYQRALGVAEVPLGMLGGAVSGVVGPLANIYGNVTSGSFGQPEGVRAGQRSQARAEQAVGYKPVTQPGAENIQAVGEALAPLIGVPLPTMNALGRSLQAPAKLPYLQNALTGEARMLGETVANIPAIKARSAATQAANVAKSYANAPQIEAAQTAQRLGVALPPSISNPTKTTRAMSAIAGREGDAKLGEGNVKQIVKLVKEDLGDTSPDPRISLATIDNALDIASAPYAPVRALPVLRVSDAATQTLKDIPKAPSIGGEAGAAAVSSLVDEALLKLSQGRNGAAVLDDIKQLRTDAQAIFKANDKGTSAPNPTATAKANAAMKIADTLEAIIDANAPPEVLPALRAARTKIAQIYDHARAIDYVSGAIDPQMYAKLLQERKGQMTGLPADIGKVAAIYPTVMSPTSATSFTAPRLVRGGMGATAGAVIGSLLGPLGAAGGLVAGSTGGAFAGNLAARRMASPAFQAKYAVPRDYRPNALAPDTGLSIAPSYEPSAFPAREAPPTQLGNQFTLGEYQPPQAPTQMTMASIDYPGYPKPPVDIVRRYQEGAEATQRATEAATRLPTGRGLALEIGPDGKLRSATQGMTGATPDVIASTGYPLSSAVEKVSSGRNFALSAEERIAWNKAKVDLADAVPGFNKLSDKAILGKMQDRAWVADAIEKAREQARGFEEIARRSTDQIVTATAEANRAKMMDLAESLGESLRARPVAKSSQGPKTRAAQRLNQLTPEDAVIVTPQNRLAP